MGSLPREEPGSSLAGYQAWLVSDNSYRLFSQVSWATSMLEICVRLWIPFACLLVPLFRDHLSCWCGSLSKTGVWQSCWCWMSYTLSLKSTVPGKWAERGIGPQEQWLICFSGFGKNLLCKISPMVFWTNHSFMSPFTTAHEKFVREAKLRAFSSCLMIIQRDFSTGHVCLGIVFCAFLGK